MSSFWGPLQKEKVLIFGHSAGGLNALGVAATVPEMVQAVVVGDAPISIEGLVALESNDERIRYCTSLWEILSSNRTQNELKLSASRLRNTDC